MTPLPKNFNFYICGYDEVSQFKDKNINWVMVYTQDGLPEPPDFITTFGELKHFTPLKYHDCWDKNLHSEILIWPDYTLAERIITTATEIGFTLVNNDVNILFACHAGISRSTATAYAILCIMLNNEKDALAYVFQKRWKARPNPLIVSLVDELCGWNGRMVKHLNNTLDKIPESADDGLLLF
jgi:hypothetical protein